MHPCVIHNNEKNQNAKMYQNVLHNMVNPYAIWFKNINTKSIYIIKEKFSCYSVRRKQEDYKIIFVQLL